METSTLIPLVNLMQFYYRDLQTEVFLKICLYTAVIYTGGGVNSSAHYHDIYQLAHVDLAGTH